MTNNTLPVLISASILIGVAGCDQSTGSNEDSTKPIIELTSLNNGEEIIADHVVTWITTEENKSSVDIQLSYDSGQTYSSQDIVVANAPDTGSYVWKTNDIRSVRDCSSCRIRIIPKDVVGNLGEADESDQDFSINNIPQVSGAAVYFDTGSDGEGDQSGQAPDRIVVPFDKDVVLQGNFLFQLPVLGDSFGNGATVIAGPSSNEISIEFTDHLTSHLKIRGKYSSSNLSLTSPSGIDVFEDLGSVVISVDTRRFAESTGGIDIAPSFSESSQLLTDSTVSVASGDIDGDGDIDIVLSGSSRPLLVNNGDGTLSGASNSLNANGSNTIVLGDFDGDDDLDVVAGFTGPNRLWFNDGSGMFVDSGRTLGDSDTLSLEIGDIDGDGDFDVVAGNVGPNTIWLNNGSGLFVEAASQLGSSHTNSVGVGDLDGDGDLDIVAGNNGEDQLWLNDGIGGFSGHPQGLSNRDTRSVSVIDIDGDNDMDIVTGNFGSSNLIWHNSGGATFDEPPYEFGNDTTEAIALGDVDGDGDYDIVSANGFNANNIWLNNSGDFDSHQELIGSNRGVTVSLALFDLDDDGDLDLFEGNAGGAFERSNDLVWINSQNHLGIPFVDSQQSIGEANTDTNSVALGDLNGNGHTDLVTGNDGANRVWFNDGRGVFSNSSQSIGDSNTQSIDLADMDGDGDLDIVAGNLGPNKVWLNNGDGMYSMSPIVFGTNQTNAISIGDLDADGDKDILVGNLGQDKVWLNDGSGQFTDSLIPLGNDNSIAVAIGDVDSDGDLDLFVSDFGDDGAIRVFFNERNNIFRPQFTSDRVEGLFAIGDVDGDGDLDIVSKGGFDLILWRNNGSGAFSMDYATDTSFNTQEAIVLSDIDGDDDLDLIMPRGGEGGEFFLSNRIFFNNGNGFFKFSRVKLVGESATISVALADLNGDGLPDLVTGNYDPPQFPISAVNRIWLNDL